MDTVGGGSGARNHPTNWSREQFDALEALYSQSDARTTEERIACLRNAIGGVINIYVQGGPKTPGIELRVLEHDWLIYNGLYEKF